MRYRILEDETPYTGKELRRGWVRERTEIEGEGAAGFVGPCHVRNEDLVDLDDARAGFFIRSERMAHVIVEHRCTLETAVLRQRLLVCILGEILRESLGGRGATLRRSGNDVYVGERKLTVSIAAPVVADSTVGSGGPTSLIHLGINVDPGGAPVPAVGLDELGIDARPLLVELLGRYAKEIESARHAEKKVRAVP